MARRKSTSKYYAPKLNSGQLTVGGEDKEMFVVVIAQHSEIRRDGVIR